MTDIIRGAMRNSKDEEKTLEKLRTIDNIVFLTDDDDDFDYTFIIANAEVPNTEPPDYISLDKYIIENVSVGGGTLLEGKKNTWFEKDRQMVGGKKKKITKLVEERFPNQNISTYIDGDVKSRENYTNNIKRVLNEKNLKFPGYQQKLNFKNNINILQIELNDIFNIPLDDQGNRYYEVSEVESPNREKELYLPFLEDEIIDILFSPSNINYFVFYFKNDMGRGIYPKVWISKNNKNIKDAFLNLYSDKFRYNFSKGSHKLTISIKNEGVKFFNSKVIPSNMHYKCIYMNQYLFTPITTGASIYKCGDIYYNSSSQHFFAENKQNEWILVYFFRSLLLQHKVQLKLVHITGYFQNENVIKMQNSEEEIELNLNDLIRKDDSLGFDTYFIQLDNNNIAPITFEPFVEFCHVQFPQVLSTLEDGYTIFTPFIPLVLDYIIGGYKFYISRNFNVIIDWEIMLQNINQIILDIENGKTTILKVEYYADIINQINEIIENIK